MFFRFLWSQKNDLIHNFKTMNIDKNKILADLSIIIGAVGLAFSIFPIYGLPLEATSLVFGFVSYKQNKLGKIGIILSAIGIVISVIIAIFGNYLYTSITSNTQQEPEKITIQNTDVNPNIDRSDTIYSPDRSMKVYLEKEFNPEIQRFTRQSVILENLKTGNKKVLNEIAVVPEDAIVRYTKDGCNEDKSVTVCCNSVIDFNEFEPMAWLTNDMIEINQYFDNYECAGKVTSKTIYDSKGANYFTADLVKKFDYKTAENTDEGWLIANICSNNDKVAFILEKNMFGGYSYLEYSKKDNKFTNQLIEIEKKSNTDDFWEFNDNCENVLDLSKVQKFFW